MIGSLGPIPFTASTRQVRTFNGLSKQAQARYAEHAVVGRKPTLEFVGPGLESISLSVRLDRFLGIEPLDEIERVTELRDAGEALPMVIGGEYLGMYVIESAREQHRHHNNRGELLVAEISLSLKEYADD